LNLVQKARWKGLRHETLQTGSGVIERANQLHLLRQPRRGRFALPGDILEVGTQCPAASGQLWIEQGQQRLLLHAQDPRGPHSHAAGYIGNLPAQKIEILFELQLTTRVGEPELEEE